MRVVASSLRAVAWVLLGVFAGGCGCAGSPGRKAEPAAESSAMRQRFWGVELVLPAGWSGGENDLGGYEWTDGELALMAGRHRLDAAESLEAFLADRRASLEEGGALTGTSGGEQRVGSLTVLTLSGRTASEGGAIEVRLLVLRSGPAEGVSLLLVGDSAKQGSIDSAWASIVGSLGLQAD
jgi:hypothetical protein